MTDAACVSIMRAIPALSRLMHLISMHVMGVHLMGVHLTGVHLMGVYLIACTS